MSQKIRSRFRLSLAARIAFFFLLLTSGVYFGLSTYITDYLAGKTEESLTQRLYHIVASAQPAIPGDIHQDLLDEFIFGYEDIADGDSFQAISEKLSLIQQNNGLDIDIYTLFVPENRPDLMVFLAMGAEEPYIGNSQELSSLVREVYATKKIHSSGIYETINGTWISAAAPIFDDLGDVQAVVQVDYNAETELAEAKKSAIVPIVIPLLGAFSLTVIAIMIQTGLMSRLIHRQLEKLSLVNKNVKDASVKLSSVEENMSSIRNHSEEQVRSIGQAQQLLNEISTTVQKNLTDSETATDLSKEALDVVRDTDSHLQSMGEQIHEIDNTTSEISKITELINSITVETNLLAFNAGIEATHAGEYGVSFSVVADSVRKLAGRTSELAKEINQLIQHNKNAVEAGVSHTSNCITSVRQSVKLVTDSSTHNCEVSVASKTQAENIKVMDQKIETVFDIINDTNKFTVHSETDLNQFRKTFSEILSRLEEFEKFLKG